MNRAVGGVLAALLLITPFLLTGGTGQYILHVLIQMFIWSFVGQAWSLMGRFGLVSWGTGVPRARRLHGGAPLELLPPDALDRAVVAVVGTGLFAAVVAYPCSRSGWWATTSAW